MNNQYRVIEETGFFQKGAQSIRARIVKTGKIRRLDVRVFVVGKDGDWRPTKRGISVPEDLQHDFANVVTQLCDRATALRKEGES